MNNGFLFSLFLFFTLTYAHLATKRLYEDLLNDYNRLIRPVYNNNDTVFVNLSLKLTQLLDINMKHQVMSTNVWIEQEWIDNQLVWDPKNYDGVDMIHIMAEDIWQPDIVLFNNADGIFEVSSLTKAIVYNTGKVFWKPPAIFRSFCQIDVQWFPFDTQVCSMKFGSLTYDGAEVDLMSVDKSSTIKKNLTNVSETLKLTQDNQYSKYNEVLKNNLSEALPLQSNNPIYDKQSIKTSINSKLISINHVETGIDMSEFYNSVEWDVLAVPAHYKKEYFAGSQNPYPDITFKIFLRRKTLFYTVNLIIPIVGNAFLTLLVFYLPSDSGEKVTLSISVLVSLTVFFLLLAEIIPPTSLAVPLLGKYLLFTMILITLSICVTVGILNIHFRSLSTHIMQPWVRSFFIETLPKYLFMHRPTLKDLQKELSALTKPNRLNFENCSTEIENKNSIQHTPTTTQNFYDHQDIQSLNSSADEDVYRNLYSSNYDTNLHDSSLPYDTDLGMPIIHNQTRLAKNNYLSNHIKHEYSYSKDVKQAIESILAIAENLKKQDEEKNVIEDWKFVAMVLDRLFLCLFTLICIVGSCIILLQAPSLYDNTPAIESPFLRSLTSSNGS
uniref:Nicotinic acetylcholine receptor n=1 Tax=Polyphagotarsonemus latus TaxID=1204166 RepID=A0AAN0LM93_9ACAR